MTSAITLDVGAVRAFVAVADLRSFTRAAEALGSTQGAVSVKLRRLEDQLGQRLVERTPRLVRLSPQGALFIDGARDFLAAHEKAVAGLSASRRRFALGIAAHVAGPEVATLLAHLNTYDPCLTIEVRIETPRALLDAFDRGELDAAIVRREDGRRDGEVLGPEQFGWFASPNLRCRPEEPLRLAALSTECGVRNIATQALDAAGIPWSEVFVGGSSSAVAAAVSAGVAIAVFPLRLAPPGTVEVSERYALPPLPDSEILLFSTLVDAKSREALRTIAAGFRSHRSREADAPVAALA
ncbi:MAG TPA: LysR family transcriptional regulator [Brevundimonas sp.]|nr:LysR family transcriptional regulator [Brevundimonas sp.]